MLNDQLDKILISTKQLPFYFKKIRLKSAKVSKIQGN